MSVPAVTGNVHEPSANTNAVVTYAADSDQHHVISGVAWSYDGTPTGGNLTITNDGNDVFKSDITAAGPGVINFDPPIRGDKNAALVATLAAGGGGVSGIVSVLGHWLEG